ncbi:hypothetical protein DFH28DRAFT_1130011 [Melampsora americana]|nr:hypothetical protein DFH28DRAFT_1130011 [Melampsora americana]
MSDRASVVSRSSSAAATTDLATQADSDTNVSTPTQPTSYVWKYFSVIASHVSMLVPKSAYLRFGEVCLPLAQHYQTALRSQAMQSIMDGDVQAYTAKDNKTRIILMQKRQTGILSNSEKWKKKLLPPRYGVDPNVKAACAFTKLVVLKDVRKEFESLRMQALQWGLNRTQYGGKSLWRVLDEELDYLRSKSSQYRYADLCWIKGSKHLEQLQASTKFPSVSKAAIKQEMQNLNETHGEEFLPDEMPYVEVEDKNKEGDEGSEGSEAVRMKKIKSYSLIESHDTDAVSLFLWGFIGISYSHPSF